MLIEKLINNIYIWWYKQEFLRSINVYKIWKKLKKAINEKVFAITLYTFSSWVNIQYDGILTESIYIY